MSFREYVASRWDELTEEAGQHAIVVALSILIATLIGVGTGVLTYRRPRLAALAVGTTSGFLTIPSFALLGLLIPFLGLGWGPTLVALVMYALLPIVRNTIVGLRGVDPAVVEACRRIGRSSLRVRLRVHVPLAWPAILAGIPVAAQQIVGITA